MRTRDDISRDEVTRDPIFLFQVRESGRQSWRTETVFLTREEGEAWGRHHEHRWRQWHVYCVPATGVLVQVLRLAEGVEV